MNKKTISTIIAISGIFLGSLLFVNLTPKTYNEITLGGSRTSTTTADYFCLTGDSCISSWTAGSMTALPEGNIYVGNSSNTATATSSVTVSATGVLSASGGNSADWTTAFSWGNHAGVYDVLGQATSTLASHTTTYNHADYDTAYGWGNHASAGYLASSNIDTIAELNTVLAGEDVASTTLPLGNFIVGNSNNLKEATSTIYLTSDGRLGLGTTDPASYISSARFLMLGDGVGSKSDFGNLNAGTGYPTYFLARAKGSFSSPTAVANNDYLGSVDFIGYDGVDYNTIGAKIVVLTDGSVAENSIPSEMLFQTNNGSALTTNLTISPVGLLTFGSATSTVGITAPYFYGNLTGTASGNLISGGTLTSAYHCRYDGTGIDCDRLEDASGACASNSVCMGGHTHVGVDEIYGSGWNSDTDTPEKDDIYDYLHLIDTNDDGDVDNIDATLKANWDTAYSWGNHAGLYDILGQATSTLASHTTAFDHSAFYNSYDDIPSASPSNGDTTHFPTADQVYDYIASNPFSYLTSVASDSDWTRHNSYPTGCTNQFVRSIGDTLTCATVDISSDTNLAAGRSLTMSGDSVEADAELYTGGFTFVIASSSIATTTAVLSTKMPVAGTITQVSGYCNTGTTTIQIDERSASTPKTAGTDIMTSALAIGGYSSTTSFSNATIAAGAYINLDVDGFLVGTPARCYIDVKYTKDD